MCEPTLIIAAVGIAITIMQAQSAKKSQQAQIDFQQKVNDNKIIAAEQDIVAREDQRQVDEGIISAQGRLAIGAVRADAATRGVIVDEGSAADRTEELAGDIAFEKLLRRHEIALEDRNSRLVAQGLRSDNALLDFQRADASREARFKSIQAGLSFAGTAAKFKFNTAGNLVRR